MADLEFLSLYPGNANITICLPDGTVQRIDRVSATTIADKCPLLFYCFENGPLNDQQASLEANSIALVISLLRYIYTGNYLTEAQENGPCSLLHHAEMYKMAQDFDVPELQVAAHVNFIRETEMSCCVPNPPIDLCAAIEFVYRYLGSQQPLIDTLLNYCVSSFKYHGLGTDSGFRQSAFHIPAFHKDLCQTNIRRDFQDEGASDIVQLPVCRPNPRSVVLDATDLHVDKRTHSEFQFHDWYDSENHGAESEPEIKTERSAKRCKTITETDFIIVHRPKEAQEVLAPEEELSSNNCGFTVVHRPKANSISDLFPEAEDANAGFEIISEATSDNESSAVAPIKNSSEGSDSEWSLI